jgi:hypothetical protein
MAIPIMVAFSRKAELSLMHKELDFICPIQKCSLSKIKPVHFSLGRLFPLWCRLKHALPGRVTGAK